MYYAWILMWIFDRCVYDCFLLVQCQGEVCQSSGGIIRMIKIC